MVSTATSAEVLFASSDMYQALGNFLCRTEPELAQALCDGSFVGDIKEILGELGFSDQEITLLTDGFAEFLTSSKEAQDELFHKVRRNYTHLFTNPKFSVMTPYEARYLGDEKFSKDGIPVSRVRVDLKDLYKRSGFESQIKPKEYEDHLRVEFEFMEVLRKNQGICLRDGNESAYLEIESTVQELFDRHLKVWALPFFEEVGEKSLENVYKVIASLALAFLKREFGR